jgi:hypothetical protein
MITTLLGTLLILLQGSEKTLDLRTQIKNCRHAGSRAKFRRAWHGWSELANVSGDHDSLHWSLIAAARRCRRTRFAKHHRQPYHLPISLEPKYQFEVGNTERRRLLCTVALYDAANMRAEFIGGFMTYMSIQNIHTFTELAPKETIVLRFQIYVNWESRNQWKEGGDVKARCSEELAIGPYAERKYGSIGSPMMESANRVRLSVR